MAPGVLSNRALNRATLARQFLLERSTTAVDDAVDHLVGLQAQVPGDPYVALWSRLERFDPEALSNGLLERRLVRIVVMRGTIHLVTADDCLALRPLMQPVLDGELSRHPDAVPHLGGVDLEPVLAAVRQLLAEHPMSGTEMRAALATRFPALDAAALTIASRCLLPLVQVPPRGLWRQGGQVRTTTAESWLGRPLATTTSIVTTSIDDVVLRYLAAFGPSTVADVSTWCRLTGLREVVDRLRPRLVSVHDERGRELFDVPDAPRPEADTAAPVRFLPEYDNVLLSHADRTRFADTQFADTRFADTKGVDVGRLYAGPGLGRGSVLHDGLVRATWRLERDKAAGRVTMAITHLPMPKRAVTSIEAEGRRLLRFLVADAEREVVVRPVT